MYGVWLDAVVLERVADTRERCLVSYGGVLASGGGVVLRATGGSGASVSFNKLDQGWSSPS
jgi:hypothetical protein